MALATLAPAPAIRAAGAKCENCWNLGAEAEAKAGVTESL